ncbi:MAG: hypothetical protein HKN91_07935 [Acidimicrobiia bacterium]|nr:hypothetical protein [Acidimicrobiia bacterium]
MSFVSESPRERLARLGIATTQRIAALEKSLEALSQATIVGATDDEHDPEGHTLAWERQQIASLLAEAREKLADIETAGERADVGNYGKCEACGRHIAAERLDALPATRVCIRCATTKS